MLNSLLLLLLLLLYYVLAFSFTTVLLHDHYIKCTILLCTKELFFPEYVSFSTPAAGLGYGTRRGLA